MLKVQGHSDLYRDESTGAIINKSSEYDKYIQKRNLRKSQAQEINDLKSDISEMKHMMNAILEKLNAN
jgi:K+/H+ antiporter YhaU regulatory subunit KhtT